jgi:hypothetical protein
LRFRILRLVAAVVDRCGPWRGGGRGHPRCETVRVLATLRRFLRKSTPWRSLRATEVEASGSTLRRCLARWSRTGLLARVHSVLVGMLRGHPDLILDRCSVRAKRGDDLTGPNPTDRGKRGTKFHVAVDGDGVPVACAATAANVSSRTGAMTRNATVICVSGSAPSPASTSAATRVNRAWARGAGPFERSLAWLLENRRLALRYDRLGFVVRSLLQAACIFLVAGRLARDF